MLDLKIMAITLLFVKVLNFYRGPLTSGTLFSPFNFSLISLNFDLSNFLIKLEFVQY